MALSTCDVQMLFVERRSLRVPQVTSPYSFPFSCSWPISPTQDYPEEGRGRSVVADLRVAAAATRMLATSNSAAIR
jgi:hypothetical protein